VLRIGKKHLNFDLTTCGSKTNNSCRSLIKGAGTLHQQELHISEAGGHDWTRLGVSFFPQKIVKHGILGTICIIININN